MSQSCQPFILILRKSDFQFLVAVAVSGLKFLQSFEIFLNFEYSIWPNMSIAIISRPRGVQTNNSNKQNKTAPPPTLQITKPVTNITPQHTCS